MRRNDGPLHAHMILAVSFAVLSAASCSLIDLRTMSCQTYPAARMEVVPEDSPVWLSFSMPPVKTDAEAAISVADVSGKVEGWTEWEGDSRIVFHPYQPYKPGVLHYLSFQGAISVESGAKHSIDIVVPFYPVTDENPPILVAASPGYGEIVPIDRPLTFAFSKPMDRLSFEREAVISETELDFQWDADFTSVTVNPDPSWTNLQVETWTLPSTIKCAMGIPLTREYKSQFLAQSDTAPPDIAYTGPAIEDGNGAWSILSSALTLSDITNAHQIYFEFDEAVDFTSINNSISIEPDLSGHIVPASPNAFVYLRDEPFIAGTTYTIVLNAGVKDAYGNSTPEDIRVEFTPDIVPLTIGSVTITNYSQPDVTILGADLNSLTPLAGTQLAYFSHGDDRFLYFTLTLSSAFPETDQPSRISFQNTLQVNAIFPLGLPKEPEITDFTWLSDSTIKFTLAGMTPSTAASTVYYEFRILGQNPDAHDGEEAYLAEDAYIRFGAPIE